MAIVTTYVCDVTGKTGFDKTDFVKITINADNSNIPGMAYGMRTFSVEKLVHVDIARKFNLVHTQNKEEPMPEVTFESKLATLLKDYITDIAYEAGSEAGADAVRNR